jgi:hypothetical protein
VIAEQDNIWLSTFILSGCQTLVEQDSGHIKKSIQDQSEVVA